MSHKSGFSAAGTSGTDFRKGAVRMFCSERPAVFTEKQNRPPLSQSCLRNSLLEWSLSNAADPYRSIRAYKLSLFSRFLCWFGFVSSDGRRIRSCHAVCVCCDTGILRSCAEQEAVCCRVPVSECGNPFGVSIRIVYRIRTVAHILHALCRCKAGVCEPGYCVVCSKRKSELGVVNRSGAGGKLCITTLEVTAGIVPTYAILSCTCTKSIICCTVTNITTVC